MKRSFIAISTAGLLGIAWLAWQGAVAASDRVAPESTHADLDVEDSPAGADVAGLLDTLTKGLRARRPQEFAFIKKVVNYVKMNKLSRKMVLETFHWARRKVGLAQDERTRYPYPYFERAMKIRAAKVGVKL